MLPYYQSFAKQKINIVESLSSFSNKDTYAESALILCAVISSISAIAWPEDNKHKNIDRKRFVEIIVKFPPPKIDLKKISAPLLVQDDKTLNNRLGISKSAFYLTEDKDLDETDLQNKCPFLGLKEIRKYSYANLLYEQIRCGYAHQYKTGSYAIDHDALRALANINKNLVSYVNVLKNNLVYRLIHFPISWIAQITESIASGIDNESVPLSFPKKWWLNG
jgi:hypothetical protein